MRSQRMNQQLIKNILKSRYNSTQEILQLSRSPKFWHHVLAIRNWNTLRIMGLSQNDINDDDVGVFQAIKWMQLLQLDLSDNQITSIGAKKLNAVQWPQLKRLKIGNNKIGNQGLQCLLKKLSKNLTLLDITSCNITGIGIRPLTGYNMTNLKKLVLNKNLIGCVGMKWLVKVDLCNLEQLCISVCQFGDEAYRHMLKGNWPLLNALTIALSQQQETSMTGLNTWQSIHNYSWKNVETLSLSQNEPIYLLSSIIAEPVRARVNNYVFYADNQQLSDCIYNILHDRQFI